ncbi:hypothetical protein [Streptomyces sp. NPDC005141]
MPVESLKALAARAVAQLDQTQLHAHQLPQEMFDFSQAVRTLQPQLEADGARFSELSDHVDDVMEAIQAEDWGTVVARAGWLLPRLADFAASVAAQETQTANLGVSMSGYTNNYAAMRSVAEQWQTHIAELHQRAVDHLA